MVFPNGITFIQSVAVSGRPMKKKVKVKSSLCNRPWRLRGEVEVYLYSFFNLAGKWGGLSTPRPDRFPLQWPYIHCIWGWVDPRASLDWWGRSCPHWDSIPQTVQPVATRCTDYAIPTHQSQSLNGHTQTRTHTHTHTHSNHTSFPFTERRVHLIKQ